MPLEVQKREQQVLRQGHETCKEVDYGNEQTNKLVGFS